MMLAAVQLFSGVLRKDANELALAPLFGLPLGNGPIPRSHALQECLGSPQQFDCGVFANLNFNDEMSVLVINGGRRLYIRNAVKKSPHIAHSPRSLTTERRDVEPAIINERKKLTHVWVGFLSAVPFKGRNALSVASSNRVCLPTLPTPANENDRPWHPLDDAA
jgi:hypothetical protein